MARKRIKPEMVFTTNIDKVPSLQKKYARKFETVTEHKPVTKSDKAKKALSNLFK